jgi:Uncharacterized protein conserved in bacteria (DUF2147)
MTKLMFLTVTVASLMAGLAHGDPLPAPQPSAAGMWAQVYADGRVGGWFLLFERDGVYDGAIAKMFLKPGEDPNPICTRCTGDQKNAPSLGLVIIKGMRRNGLVYQEGSILDPRDGHVYKAKLTLSADGQRLTVRGFLGIELLGQDQVWKRLPNDVMTQAEIPLNLVPYWLALQNPSNGMTTNSIGTRQTGSVGTTQPAR